MNINVFFQFLFFNGFTLLFFGCNENPLKTHVPSEIIGLSSVIYLTGDNNCEIDLNDYFIDIKKIDSVLFNKTSYVVDSLGRITIPFNDSIAFILSLFVYTPMHTYAIPVKKSTDKLIEIIYPKNVDNVSIKGEFTNWLPQPMVKRDSIWIFHQKVKPAIYQFCFVIDGIDQLSTNYSHVSNGIGGFNCLINADSYLLKKPVLNFKLNEENKLVFTSDDTSSRILAYFNNTLIVDNEIVKDGCVPVLPDYTNDIELGYIRAWALSNNGYSQELLLPYVNGRLVLKSDELPRYAPHKMTMYNVFVDRFYDGDSTNQPIMLDSVLPQAQYLGGDVKGVIKQLENSYFDSIGINTIWVSPLVQNTMGAWGSWAMPKSKFSSYHGYWPTSFTRVNRSFTTENELHDLIDLVHDQNKNILLDVVANHIHKDHPFYQTNPDYFTDLYLPDGTMNTERWDDYRLTTWFDVFLPTLNLEREEVYTMLADSIFYWLDKYHLDGFRHDATKHIPEIFWKELTKKIKKEYINTGKGAVFQIGETYGSHDLVGSYVNSGQLDAQFDFNVYDAIMKVLCDGASWSSIVQVINKSQSQYGDHHLMGNISGNQDKGRSISYFGGDLLRNEDAKVAGWNREIEIGEEVLAFKKMKIMHLINSTIPGIPVVYYGDEIGMPGGNDPDCRRMMRFDGLSEMELDLKKTVSSFLKTRQLSMPLIYGNLRWDRISDDLIAYSRIYGEDSNTIYIYKGSDTIELEHDGTIFNLAPWSYKVFTNGN